MELDEYKTMNKEELSIKGSETGDGVEPLQNLISEMKEKDKQERKALLYLVIMFFVFVTIYLAQLGRQTGVMQAGYAILASGFILALLYFYLKFRNYAKISYSEPVLLFLKAAERRYAYWTIQDLLVAFPLTIFMGIGGGLIVFSSFNKYFPESPLPLMIYCLIYFTAIFIGFWAGRKQWEKAKRPLYEKIRQLRKEFGG
jgi:hypothetical protein